MEAFLEKCKPEETEEESEPEKLFTAEQVAELESEIERLKKIIQICITAIYKKETIDENVIS